MDNFWSDPPHLQDFPRGTITLLVPCARFVAGYMYPLSPAVLTPLSVPGIFYPLSQVEIWPCSLESYGFFPSRQETGFRNLLLPSFILISQALRQILDFQLFSQTITDVPRVPWGWESYGIVG